MSNKIFLVLAGLCILLSCKKEDAGDAEKYKPYLLYKGVTDGVHSLDVSMDDNILIGGNYGNSVMLLKVTKSGSLIWRKEFGKPGIEFLESAILSLRSGNIKGSIMICAFSESGGMRLIKTTSDGNFIWMKKYGDALRGDCMLETYYGSIVIAGRTSDDSDPLSHKKLFLTKLDEDGSIIWHKPFTHLVRPRHMVETKDRGYLIVAHKRYDDPEKTYLFRFNAGGELLWEKEIPTRMSTTSAPHELANGDLLIAGISYYPSMMLLDENGEMRWLKSYEEYVPNGYLTPYPWNFDSMKENSDGTFTIAGTRIGISDNYVYLVKVDQQGEFIKYSDYTDRGLDPTAVGLVEGLDDSSLVIGTLRKSPYIFTISADKDGNF